MISARDFDHLLQYKRVFIRDGYEIIPIKQFIFSSRNSTIGFIAWKLMDNGNEVFSEVRITNDAT